MAEDRTGEILRELLQPHALENPYALYDRLRREQVAGREVGRVVLGHAEAMGVLGDRTWSSDRVTTTLSGFSPDRRRELDPLEQTLRGIVAFKDPPDHRRVRSLLQRSFTPGVIRRQREVVAATADRLIDRFAARHRPSGDLVSEVLFPLPAVVVGGILGIPESRITGFQRAAQQLVWWFGAGRADDGLAVRTRSALVDARALVTELLTERRDSPTDDLLSAMLAASDVEHDDATVLPEDEVLANAIFLMTAGHETAANALANSLVALLTHPEDLDRVKSDGRLDDAAVDELLRFDSPVQVTARLATGEREHRGIRLAPGDSLVIVLGAANRDPERFEDPHRLRLDRADNHPLSFAHGAHYCLGAALAKEEMRTVIPEVLCRLPGLELLELPTYQPTLDFRGPTKLMVAWR